MRKKISKGLNLERKEVKMMKKIVFLMLLSIIVLSFMGTTADAVPVPAGDIRFSIADWSFFDDPIPFGPNNPSATGNIWSTFRIDTISDANGNIVWNTGEGGQYLHGVVGNMKLHVIAPDPAGDPLPGTPSTSVNGGLAGTPITGPTYHVGLPGVGFVDDDWIDAGTPHNAYYVAANLTADPMYPGTGMPYLFVFLSNEDDLIGSATDAYESGPGAGGGAYGTYGGDIITGTPFLFGNLNATALGMDELWKPFAAEGVDVFRASTVSSTTAQTRFYLDVDPTIGVGASFDTNTLIAGTDIRVDITNEFRNPASFKGWNSQSSGQGFANTIPEPSTIILLGAGLLGVGFYARKRIKK